MVITSKKRDSNIKKHQKIFTLTIAKRETVNRMVSKVLANKQFSDTKAKLIMTEVSQYGVLKEPAQLTCQPSRPDVENIKKDIRSEVQKEGKNTHCQLELTFGYLLTSDVIQTTITLNK